MTRPNQDWVNDEKAEDDFRECKDMQVVSADCEYEQVAVRGLEHPGTTLRHLPQSDRGGAQSSLHCVPPTHLDAALIQQH